MKLKFFPLKQPLPNGAKAAWFGPTPLCRLCCVVLLLGISIPGARAQGGFFGLRFPPGWALFADWDPAFPAPGVLPGRFVWTELFPGKQARNQGQCGSCWAFATVGALEYQVMLYERSDVDLSEQWLVR